MIDEWSNCTMRSDLGWHWRIKVKFTLILNHFNSKMSFISPTAPSYLTLSDPEKWLELLSHFGNLYMHRNFFLRLWKSELVLANVYVQRLLLFLLLLHKSAQAHNLQEITQARGLVPAIFAIWSPITHLPRFHTFVCVTIQLRIVVAQ